MPTTREDISRWLEDAFQNKARWMLVICDSFDYTDYHTNYREDQRGECIAKIEQLQSGKDSMQRLMEVFDLAKPLGPQMEKRRSMEIPSPLPDPGHITEVQVRDG